VLNLTLNLALNLSPPPPSSKGSLKLNSSRLKPRASLVPISRP
jgi:hypothetical protein